jgi:hypothetical protein
MLVCIGHRVWSVIVCLISLDTLVSVPEQGQGKLGACLRHAEPRGGGTICRYASAVGQDSSVGIATCYRLDGPGFESHWGVRYYAPIQTGPGAHPASYTLGLYWGAQRPGRSADHPPPSSDEVKERVELYMYSPSGASWPVIGWTFYVSVMWRKGCILLEIQSWLSIAHVCVYLNCYDIAGGHTLLVTVLTYLEYYETKFEGLSWRWLLVHHLTCWHCNAQKINPTRKLVWSLKIFDLHLEGARLESCHCQISCGFPHSLQLYAVTVPCNTSRSLADCPHSR